MRAVAWVGAGLFAASLAWFSYFYAITLGPTVAPGWSAGSTTAIAVNLVLFAIFAAHHSVLARSGAKAWVRRVLPPALERSAYVWVASLLLIAVCVSWRPLPGIAWQAAGVWRWPLHLVQAFGVFLTIRSAAIIDIWDLAGVRQIGPRRRPGETAARPADAPAGEKSAPPVFKVEGPYGWVRHPIYLGWMLIVFGVPTMTSGRLLFATVSSLYLLMAIPWEERSLVAEYGHAYRAYRREVRARVFPGLW